MCVCVCVCCVCVCVILFTRSLNAVMCSMVTWFTALSSAKLQPSWLELENIPTTSLLRDKTSVTTVLDMTLNRLMARLQPRRFGECGLPLYCHCFQAYSNSK